MKLPNTNLELVDEIYQSIEKGNKAGSQRYRQLTKILPKVDGNLIFEAAIEVFSDTTKGRRRFEEQEFAGKLLADLDPKPTNGYDLQELLLKVLPNYNLSVEELPFFLAKNFGLDKLIKELALIKSNTDDEEIIESISAFEFWIKQNR